MFEYHSTITKSPWEMINNQTKKRKKENGKVSLSQEEIEHINLLIYV